MMKTRILLFMMGIMILLSLLGGCGQKDKGISVEDVWARPGLAEGNSAVFFVIKNSNGAEDKLISAYSDVAGAVELHKSSMVDGAMKMEMQKFVTVPADDSIIFKPGDFHVMLIGLNDDLSVGDEFEVSLQFEAAGEIVLDVVVREP
jgi:copper(I)-binding protein